MYKILSVSVSYLLPLLRTADPTQRFKIKVGSQTFVSRRGPTCKEEDVHLDVQEEESRGVKKLEVRDSCCTSQDKKKVWSINRSDIEL